uniref:17 kDa globin-like antigen (Fragments) n=1 Tax=Ostertagia ostertagi TaxID=6317 RepID=Q9TXF0_OSTOS
YLFGHHPDLRGAKQGTALVMHVHIFANLYDNDMVFR